MTHSVEQISSRTSEQAAVLGTLDQAVREMDRTTQQNAAMVEESASAIHGLASDASELAELVSQFVIEPPDHRPVESAVPIGRGADRLPRHSRDLPKLASGDWSAF